jgi:predicted RNA-binding Zn-ribbon protein involved in translation (DUF1610 family)
MPLPDPASVQPGTWIIIGIIFAVTLIVMVVWRRRKSPVFQCPNCGWRGKGVKREIYQGQSFAVCPECGETHIPPEKQ